MLSKHACGMKIAKQKENGLRHAYLPDCIVRAIEEMGDELSCKRRDLTYIFAMSLVILLVLFTSGSICFIYGPLCGDWIWHLG